MFYAIYKGDKFLATFDTIVECAKFLGIKTQSARWLATPSYFERCRNNDERIKIYRYEE